MSISIEKHNCSQYNIKCTDIGSHWWAVIIVSRDGVVNIQSDFGDYCYIWSSIGETSIEEFLINCDKSYLLRKFGGMKEREFDLISSKKEIQRYIIEKRRMLDITENEARFYWNRCLKIKAQNTEEYMKSISKLETKFNNKSILDLYNDDISSVPHITKYSYSITTFFEKIWPIFINELKKEIKSRL